MNGDFFVCFYGYRILAVAVQLENVTKERPTSSIS